MKNIRLLLVDDEDDFRQTLAKRLTKKGIPPEQEERIRKAEAKNLLRRSGGMS